MSDEHWYSATQVSTFELCPRKWAWRSIDRVETQENKFAQLGTDTHTVLERWLREKIVPNVDTPEGKVAAAIVPHLPPPQSVDPKNVEIELMMKLSGFIYVGKIDLYMPAYGPPSDKPHSQYLIPSVYDHKSTSDFKWALTQEEMHRDIQATLYASWGFLRHQQAERVRVQWTYGRTKGAAKSLPVVREFKAAEIRDRLVETIETTKIMSEVLASGAKALDVPFDAGGCEAFGGCPYQDRCNLSAKQKMESIMTQGATAGGFLDRLKANKAKQNGAAVTPPQAVNPPVQTAEPATTAGMSIKEKLAAKKAAQGAATPPTAEPEQMTPTPEPEAPKKGRGRKATQKPEEDKELSEELAAGVAEAHKARYENECREHWQEVQRLVLSRSLLVLDTLAPDDLALAASEIADKAVAAYAERFPFEE